ncbi:hypothetical protein EZV62_012099 [Acer yangbiense]|uniref:Ubiquitin-like protease family profile domain-containing protein n=1 Tax=Acer yangbiense TaxID=1000413 RepID=A0A5C7HWN1_9ROSI|nr:hypothetical protein EZV62_012099 [Acer yangbiense]
MTSCFKHFSNVLTNWLFSAQIVHNLLLREITVDGAGENELFVSLGGKNARFGQREFCMVTGLRFGELSDIINTPYVGNANGIQERYWPGEEGHELKLSTVNTKKRSASIRYRLYGFPWAIEVWAMEAVQTLIDGFGLRLEHTLPRMRRWTMHKRPHNFVKIISELEANIRSGKAQVLEVLEATDDEAQKDYMVGVDFDMSEGPQFIPPVEMEMKENNESLDDLDDGNDGDDGALTQKTAVKRKAQKKKKKTSAKKQRKSIPITSLDEEDPLQSSYSTGYTPTPEDFTAEDPSTPHDQFTPGYTPTPLEDMLHPPPPRHRTRSPFQQNPPPISSRQEPRSRGGDRITELLEAVKALPNEMERIVKREVSELSQLPGVLKALVQEIEPTRGQRNKEAPLIEVIDQSLHVKEVGTSMEKELAPTAMKDMAPTVEKEVAGSVLSPFLDPTRASETKREGQKQKYEAFKRKKKLVIRNVGTEEFVDQSFFLELEQPKNWLSTDHIDVYMSLLVKRRESEPENFRHSLVLLSSEFYTKLNVEWQRIIEADKEAKSSFDVLGFECPPDWIEYGCGGRPGWGQPWWLYTQLLIPCYVGEPDGHWILCKVDLLDRHISICDPTGAKKKSNYGVKYHEEYAETAIVKSADWNWGQKDMPKFRKEIAFDIYNNSVTFKSPID